MRCFGTGILVLHCGGSSPAVRQRHSSNVLREIQFAFVCLAWRLEVGTSSEGSLSLGASSVCHIGTQQKGRISY